MNSKATLNLKGSLLQYIKPRGRKGMQLINIFEIKIPPENESFLFDVTGGLWSNN